MPQRYPLGNIRRTYDKVKDVAAICSVRLWDHGHDGFLWVHPIAVINIPSGSGNISNNIQNPKGEVVPITVSQYGRLVEVGDGWLNSGVHKILCVSPEWVSNTH